MNEIVKYDWNGEQITLTPNDVRKYISTDERVTDKEVFLFLKLCQAQKLNPFVKEAYLIKYGDSPAQMVVGIETFLKRAEANPDFDGMETTDSGNIKDGTYRATTKVYRKNLSHPITVTVDYNEYVGTTAKGAISFIWKTKPKTMTKKVSECQALRKAFTIELGDLYEETELQQQVKPIIDITEEEIPETDEDKKKRKETDYVKEGKEGENEIEKVPEEQKPQEYDDSASEAQLRVMKRFKIAIPKKCTKAQADKLIKDNMAKSKKKPVRGNGQEALIVDQEPTYSGE